MRDGHASVTAQRVAAYRLGFARVGTTYGRPQADDDLAGDVAAGVRIDPTSRMAAYLRARTEFADRAVVTAIADGIGQLVVIGAGYDARALRYAAPDARWFEVDHPDTQADKRARLSRLGIDAAAVTFVAADLVGDDVAVRLADAGFDPARPALFGCEGVVAYLDAATVDRLLRRLPGAASVRSRLAITGPVPGSDPERRAAFAAHVARLGEPAAFGAADLPALLAGAGWEMTAPADEGRLGFWLTTASA